MADKVRGVFYKFMLAYLEPARNLYKTILCTKQDQHKKAKQNLLRDTTNFYRYSNTSNNISNNHTFTSFLQNSNNESFKKLLFSGKTGQNNMQFSLRWCKLQQKDLLNLKLHQK